MKKIFNIALLIIYVLTSMALIYSFKSVLTLMEFLMLILFILILLIAFCYLLKKGTMLFILYPCIIMMILSLITFQIKANNLFSFVSDVITYENVVDNYRLVSLNGKYDSIEDLEGKKIGYTNQYLNYDNFSIDFNPVIYTSSEKLIEDLNNEVIDAAIMFENEYNGLEFGKYTIVSKIGFIEEILPVTKENTDNTFLIYVSAIDNNDINNLSGQSDVNIVVGLNTKTHQLLLIIIPRDYYIYLPSKNAKDKMSHASIYGINEAIKAIENLLENNIDYYVRINFSSLSNLIDKLGLIEVESEYSFISSGVEFKEGINYLNGTEALIFARERRGMVGGDRTKGGNKERVLESTFNKLIAESKYLDNLNELKKVIKTNIPEKEIISLIKNKYAYNYEWNVTKYLLNGIDEYEYTYTYKCCKLSIVKPNLETVYNAITSIDYLKNDGIFG